MSDPITLFVVEGEKRDYRFVKEMERCFMQGRYEVTIINLPAAQNIYMLYEQLCADDFDTDVVELLRESVPQARIRLEGVSRRSIEQIYLFFDFDPHQDNLVGSGGDSLDVVERMLEVFNNETEHGRLYISYPMVEALYDHRRDSCQAFSKCFVPLEEINDYKRSSGDGNVVAGARMLHAEWEDALEAFALRVRCLLDLDGIDFDYYREKVTPLELFHGQRGLLERDGCVFVLSAFPEFLLDYFKRDFWNSHVKRKKYAFDTCARGR